MAQIGQIYHGILYALKYIE